MNVPKTPDYKLIGACRALVNDCIERGAVDFHVLSAVLHEAADRLAELTQPQPIETAPRDGAKVIVIGGALFSKVHYPEGSRGLNTMAIASWLETDEGGFWLIDEKGYFKKWVSQPPHWLPCVAVDPASLGGQANG